MKKFFFVLVFSSLLFPLNEVRAYTSSDVSNASFLATEGIIVKQSSTSWYRLDDTITRAEAVGIALKIKKVLLPNNYTCKNYFIDAPYNPSNNWICRAVELAKDNGIVSWENIKARPADPITRSEVLAMIMHAALNNSLSIVPKWYKFSTDTVEWQQNIFYAAEELITVTGTNYDYTTHPISVNYFPNRNATRAEVFAFARNILSPGDNEVTSSYTVELGSNPDVNKFSDEPKILYIKKWDTKIEIDRGYIGNYFILWDLLLYEWSLTWGTKVRIFSLNTMEIIDEVIWWKISTDKKYVFGCAFESFCSIFSLGKQRTIYSITLDESGEYWELKYLWNDKFNLPDKKVVDFNKTSLQIDETVILYQYYWLISEWSLKTAYEMRSPASMTYEKFESLYKNLSAAIESYDNDYQTWGRTYNSIQVDHSTVKNLWNSTYEFIVYTTEGKVKTTYKVKSKVDFANFKINNISSVKQ